MNRILTSSEAAALKITGHTPSRWTTIIPAAGRGSRLGSDLPKALYPISGKPMIARMVELFAPLSERFVFVVSEQTRAEIDAVLREVLSPERYQIVLQLEPKGMADAVQKADGSVSTPFCCVAWVDQVALLEKTIRTCMEFHEARENARLTVPTILRQNPYIHFERDTAGRIVRVLQAREGEIKVNPGENDCGLFAFTTRDLFRVIAEAKMNGAAQGLATGEFNLLPLMPRFEVEEGAVLSLRIVSEEETIGVNTPGEAVMLEKVLSSRAGRAS